VTDDALAGSGIRGDAAMRRAVLLGERPPCETRWSGRGEKVVQRTTWGSWATAFRDNAVVLQAVVVGEAAVQRTTGGMQRCVCILFAHRHGRDKLE
jgi:hypothetical protein